MVADPLKWSDDYTLSQKRLRALDRTDEMPAHLRACVHEFGLPIVTACQTAGITNPTTIRTLVREIWAGARQDNQGNNVYGTLDWLLIQAGAKMSGKGLRRLLADNNLAIVTVEPTRGMLEASMAEVSGHNVRCTREEKHRLRLRAALRSAMSAGLK